MLFAILQKYDFSSKSQLLLTLLICQIRCLRYCKSTIFQANHNKRYHLEYTEPLFAILQKYDFSSKSQPILSVDLNPHGCLRYCKSTIFQANHNIADEVDSIAKVVCDTAKVRFFKQITTIRGNRVQIERLFAILQKYDFSSKSQLIGDYSAQLHVVCDTAKVRFFKQITTGKGTSSGSGELFAILQKYDFSSKSQRERSERASARSCLRYCKSTIFQANHNHIAQSYVKLIVVCDTAKVRFFKQITTQGWLLLPIFLLFAILQKYDFSSKSQLRKIGIIEHLRCLRYCKSTIFQANHNAFPFMCEKKNVVCDTAKVRFFKQITTSAWLPSSSPKLFAILQKYDFSSKSQLRYSVSKI